MQQNYECKCCGQVMRYYFSYVLRLHVTVLGATKYSLENANYTQCNICYLENLDLDQIIVLLKCDGKTAASSLFT